jgi:hypothetical protein
MTEPALTAEEWKEKSVRHHRATELDDYYRQHPGVWLNDRNALCTSYAGGALTYSEVREPIDLVAVIALANAALPDDDPRKITRRDVRRCNDIADGLEREYAAGRAFEALGSSAIVDEWRTLAARLVAYLPPETGT